MERELKQRGFQSPVPIFQLGYRTNVEASKGTHARGGCVDLDGTPTDAEIDIWRLWGWTMQARYLSGIDPHCHGWPYKCPHLSPAAQDQEADWDRRDAGLQGTGQVQGRWPVKPWDVALEERKALFTSQLGVPLMADAEPIKIDFDGAQPLVKDDPAKNDDPNIWINAEKYVSIVVGASTGVDIRATITVSGLKPGERVQLYFRKQWKKDGADSLDKGNDDSVFIYGGSSPSVHFTFAGSLGKADTGWTPVIRIGVRTNSETAVVTKRQIRGWKLT